MTPNKKSIVLLMIVTMYSLQGLSQENSKIDSLLTLSTTVKDHKELSQIYRQVYDLKFQVRDRSNAESIVELCKKHASSSQDKETIIQSEVVEGRFLYWQSKYTESYDYCKGVEVKARKANMPLVSAYLLGLMSDIQGLLGNYVLGLELAQKGLALRVENKASEGDIADSYVNIANFHGTVNNLDQSTAYYKKAKNIYTQLNDTLMTSRMLMYMGLDRTIAGEYDEAKYLLNESLQNFRKLNDKNSLIDALSNLGSVEQNLGNLDQAQAYYNEAQSICIEIGQKLDLSTLYQRNAHLNIDKKNWDKAIEYARKGIAISLPIGDKESLRREYKYLYKSYEAKKQYALAFENLAKYTLLNDSLSNSQTISKLNELELKYQTEKKENEIRLLTEQNTVSKFRTRGLILGILSLIGLFGVFAFAMKQRIKKKEIEKEKLDQELAFKNEELVLRKNELSAYALQIAQKNKILEGIKTDIKGIKAREESTKSLQKIMSTIDYNQNNDLSWRGFRTRFLEVHKDFESNAIALYPTLTSNEIRYISLIKMNLSSKEIAAILNISSEGIKKARYRLRKKLNLHPSDSLEELIQKL